MGVRGEEFETELDVTGGDDDDGSSGEDRGDELGEGEDRGDNIEGEGSAQDYDDVANETDDDEGSADAGADDDGEGGEDAGGKPGIPQSRLNEVIKERNELRERVRHLEESAGQGGDDDEAVRGGGQDDPEPYDFDAAEESYMDAVYSGDKDKAKAIRREINEERDKQVMDRMAQQSNEAMTQQEMKRDLESAASSVLKAYPFLDSSSEAANENAIGDVVGWRDMYIAQGHTWGDALRMAADKVGPLYAPADKGDQGGDKQAPANPEKERQGKARQRNAKDANRQPPRGGGVGDRSSDTGDLDMSKLTEEEFDNLSERDKAIARGDIVEEDQ